MKADDVVAVSGLPGLYKMVAPRDNGMIIEDIDQGTTKFASVRKHQFTPLGTVAIYTDSDATELTEVFQRMLDQEGDLPVPGHKESNQVLFEYFEEIVPDYDRDQVLISDVKKVVKWYTFLRTRGLFPFDAASDEEE